MTIAAQLTQASKRFGAVTALDRVSFALETGTLTALLGANGAGKTTAVRSLLGLCRLDSGSASIFGSRSGSMEARFRCGAMLQVGQVPAMLRVREHIGLFSSYYKRPLPLEAVVEAAGLAGLEDRPFGRLSGGQQQRVLFAIAICGRPELLVLDEPTAGLDVESRRAIWRHVRQIVAAGAAVLLTTHYLEEADALADRVLLIDRGRIAAEGTPASLKAQTAQRQIRCLTKLDAARIAALPGVVRVSEGDGRFEIDCVNPDDLLPRLYALDPTLHGLEVNAAALEDAFLALTATTATNNEEMAR